ncbi:MAG: beta-galactosidase [Candidatus Fervidibacter sp.]|uniref:beta-galactosidase n=1 Tax=Candidatus Fervidibacter sp. TaxID=3100871 RepID=UPI004049DCA1
MVGWMLLWAIAGGWMERPQLNASDVVFMYAPKDSQLYTAYSGTVVGWAGRARSKRSNDVQWFRQRVEEAHKNGLRYCGSVDFVVDFGGFIDFRPETFMESVCRDLDGNPITVPWLWDLRHKGHPAYWFCTNSHDYRAYIRDQVERACTAPIDGLHIDDWRGTAACSAWFGGCFCRNCKEEFRGWLKRNFTAGELKALGIESIDNFDFQGFLKVKGVTAEQWRRQRSQMPLGDLFQRFQTEKMLQLVREVFEYAEQLRGKPLLRSVNSSASSPEALAASPLIDYFCGEIDHHASGAHVPVEPAFIFRLVEGLGKRQAATAGGYDWAWIAANEKPGLVRTWIAQAYAFGSTFMVPHRQWCYTHEKGTHWWEGKTEDFAFIFRFIREHASLLDGYRSLANVALLYTHLNFADVRGAALEMLQANVPFSICVLERDLGVEVSQDELKNYALLVAGKQPLPRGINQTVEASKVPVIQWRSLKDLPEPFRLQVIVKGSEKVRVSLRYKRGDLKAPVVCHLLNQDYDIQTDDVRPASVSVSISRPLLSKALRGTPKSATIYAPGGKPMRVPVKVEGERVSFSVPELGLWAIVAIGDK